MGSLSPAEKALSGAIASVLANTIVYPLDLVKTIIQTQEKGESTYQGSWDCLQKLYKNKGLDSLYSGLSSSLVGTALQNFYYFYWYSVLRNLYLKLPNKSAKNKKIFDELLIGILALCVTQLFITPVNVVTTKQQTLQEDTGGETTDEKKEEATTTPALAKYPLLKKVEESKVGSVLLKNSMIGAGVKIAQEEGVGQLWNGLKVSLVLSVNPSITYGSYERLKNLFFKNKEFLNPLESFGLGLLSKIIATLLTQPLIVSKANLQKSSKYKNFQSVLVKIYKEEGTRGLWKGLLPQIVKASLVQGFLFMFKEQFDLLLIFIFRLLKVSRFSTRSKKLR